MAIFVGKQRVTGEKLAELIYAQNKLFKRMVKAWRECKLDAL
jgi:hypothetical protein